jgi:hypothetical protein
MPDCDSLLSETLLKILEFYAVVILSKLEKGLACIGLKAFLGLNRSKRSAFFRKA